MKYLNDYFQCLEDYVTKKQGNILFTIIRRTDRMLYYMNYDDDCIESAIPDSYIHEIEKIFDYKGSTTITL